MVVCEPLTAGCRGGGSEGRILLTFVSPNCRVSVGVVNLGESGGEAGFREVVGVIVSG